MHKDCLIFTIVFWGLDKFISLNSSHEDSDIWIMEKLQKSVSGNVFDTELEMLQ